MNITKKCRICELEKICSIDNSVSEFYGRLKSNNSSEKRYSPDCKTCQKEKQNKTNKKNRVIQKANTDIGCPTAETLILQTLKKMENYIDTGESECKQYADTYVQLIKQVNIEKKINTDQFMYFSKQDINYDKNKSNTAMREGNIRSVVSSYIMNTLQKVVNTDNIYVFDRLDTVKIVVDEDIVLSNDLCSAIKTQLATVLM